MCEYEAGDHILVHPENPLHAVVLPLAAHLAIGNLDQVEQRHAVCEAICEDALIGTCIQLCALHLYLCSKGT